MILGKYLLGFLHIYEFSSNRLVNISYPNGIFCALSQERVNHHEIRKDAEGFAGTLTNTSGGNEAII